MAEKTARECRSWWLTARWTVDGPRWVCCPLSGALIDCEAKLFATLRSIEMRFELKLIKLFFLFLIQWSAYGPCSQSCGVAIKSRKRACGNPSPKFGGRVCIGSDRQEIYCNNLPPCPQPTLNVQIDGQWGPFGEWSECSTACGGGFRLRQRKCDDPAPL